MSTHFFRGDGLVRSLEETGTLDEVLATGAPPLGCEYFSVDGGPLERDLLKIRAGSATASRSVARPWTPSCSGTRSAPGSTSSRGARSWTCSAEGDTGRSGACRRDASARHRASVVVGAAGRRSTVAGLVGAPTRSGTSPHGRCTTATPPTGISRTQIGPEFLLDGDSFCYAFPSDGGTTCLAVSLRLDEHLRADGDAGGRLEEALRGNLRTADRIDRATWVSGVYQGLPADSVWRAGCGAGWALVGDAGTAQDPWAGVGMDSAARQAEAFAEAFLEDPQDWAEAYERRRRERTYQDFAETTLLAPDLRQILG